MSSRKTELPVPRQGTGRAVASRTEDDQIRVLLVEDNPVDAHLVRALLERAEHPSVALAQVGTVGEALDRLQRDPFDAVLLDLFLPDARDLEAVERILAAAPQLPIVVLTVHDDERLGVQAVHLGAQDYLGKAGISPEVLRRVLRYAIERKVSAERERQLIRETAARQEAEAAQQRIECILESITDAFFAVDREWRFTYVNGEAEALLDRPRDELLGRNLWELYPASAKREFYPQFHRAVEEQVTVEFDEYSPRPDRWLQVRAYPGGEGLTVYLRDVTDRKRAEEALHESQVTMETIVAASPDIVEVLDMDGLFRWVSPAVRHVLGYDPEEVRGRSILDLLPAEERGQLEAALRQLADGGTDEVRVRYQARHRDGQWVRMEARGRAIRNEILRGLVLVARDITEQEQLEDSLRAAKEAAEAASRAKSDLLSRASHELRTPLNAILGFGQLLELEVEGEENQESVGQILSAGRHLLALINEVLDIARIEAGRISLSIEPVPVRDVLRESLDLVRHTSAEASVSLLMEDASGPERFVWADEQRLKQVLLNLLSNAIKYNRRGGTVTVTLHDMEDGNLRIAVRDSGHGIPADKLQRLFTPFERLDAERGAVKGTGLGLALSHALAEAMGGELSVESVVGEGSTFWIELPQPQPGEVASSSSRDRGAAERKTGPPTHTILLVEDNLANARLIGHILERRAHVRLLTAMQGRRGLELARETRPDLVILDLNLPDVPGDQVLLELQADPDLRQVPVVIISGGVDDGQVEQLLLLGAKGFLPKPFEIQELLRMVDESLHGEEH